MVFEFNKIQTRFTFNSNLIFKSKFSQTRWESRIIGFFYWLKFGLTQSHWQFYCYYLSPSPSLSSISTITSTICPPISSLFSHLLSFSSLFISFPLIPPSSFSPLFSSREEKRKKEEKRKGWNEVENERGGGRGKGEERRWWGVVDAEYFF